MLSQTFAALADPTRRQILELLKEQNFRAGDLGKNFSITAPSLSHHLNVLKQADLISSERQGQEIIYSLNLSVFEELTEMVMSFFKTKNN